jgi:hypothetical protein
MRYVCSRSGKDNEIFIAVVPGLAINSDCGSSGTLALSNVVHHRCD